eukprot:768377-Hanusia_phi.AAC.5
MYMSYLVSLGITILFGKTKIDDVDLIRFLSKAHKKVVRFDVTMYKALGMNKFYTTVRSCQRHGDIKHRKYLNICSANIKTVFRLNFLEQKLKRSSKLGPRRSMTITL